MKISHSTYLAICHIIEDLELFDLSQTSFSNSVNEIIELIERDENDTVSEKKWTGCNTQFTLTRLRHMVCENDTRTIDAKMKELVRLMKFDCEDTAIVERIQPPNVEELCHTVGEVLQALSPVITNMISTITSDPALNPSLTVSGRRQRALGFTQSPDGYEHSSNLNNE
jgi:hypothetical protein